MLVLLMLGWDWKKVEGDELGGFEFISFIMGVHLAVSCVRLILAYGVNGCFLSS